MSANQIVYASGEVPHLEGRTFQNPKFFDQPVEGATKVYIEAGSVNERAIRNAYEEAGVSVSDLSEMRSMPGQARKAPKPAPQPSVAETPAGAEPKENATASA